MTGQCFVSCQLDPLSWSSPSLNPTSSSSTAPPPRPSSLSALCVPASVHATYLSGSILAASRGTVCAKGSILLGSLIQLQIGLRLTG